MINVSLMDNLKMSDNPRMVLISILNAAKVPPPLKVMGYAFLNSASELDIAKLKDLFLKVMGYIEAKDKEGLSEFLSKCGFNAEIVKMVLYYANANSNKDQ